MQAREPINNPTIDDVAAHTRRMDSLMRVMARMAHDMNNLLGGVTGNVELGLDDVTPEHPVYESLIEIRKAADRSVERIKRFRYIAARAAISPTRFSLAEWLPAVCSKILAQSDDGQVQCEHIIPVGETGAVAADQALLKVALTELCANACRAVLGAAQARITIAVKTVNCPSGPPSAYLAAAPGSYVRLRVQDNGCGIPPEQQPMALEPFFSAWPKMGREEGMGLAIVYGIVRQHGGSIQIESVPGQGTRIDLYLPAA